MGESERSNKRAPGCAVEVDTSAYEWAHGRRPSGHGQWAFGSRPNAPLPTVVWFSGSYSEAKAAAVKWARARGLAVVFVQS